MFSLAPHDSGLAAELATVGHRTVLNVSGEVDMASAGAFRDALATLTRSSERDLWVDLSLISFMDSTGMHALADMRVEVEHNGRRLTIICPPGPVRRVLGLSGLDGVLSIFPDRASAQFAA